MYRKSRTALPFHRILSKASLSIFLPPPSKRWTLLDPNSKLLREGEDSKPRAWFSEISQTDDSGAVRPRWCKLLRGGVGGATSRASRVP